MFDENQLIEVKWSNKTRKHYESKGYRLTKYGDTLLIKAKDLTHGSGQKVVVNCDYCHEDYYVQYVNYNQTDRKNKVSKDACNKCRTKKQHETTYNERAKKQFDRARKFCSEKDYELLTDESEYTGVSMTISYRCKKHGVQSSTLGNFIEGHGCIHCSYEERGKKCRHSIDYIISIIESYNDNKLLNPEDYIGSNEHNLIIECGLCGTTYETSFSDYVSNMQIRCYACSNKESKGEFAIRCVLNKYNILFSKGKTYDDCRDVRCLPFDFYVPEYNLLIEFDGQQHFGQYNNFGDYETVKKHDEIKNKYCKDNNINLLRIPYWDFNKIEEILLKELNL